jgi:methyl-accepting chemotaxis protein
MKNLTLQQKIVYPILGAFSLLAIAGSWYFVTSSIDETELLYREELQTLTAASAYMTHTTAVEFLRTKGVKFHRFFLSTSSSTIKNDNLGQQAAAIFHRNPNLRLFADKIKDRETVFLAVFIPTEMKPECISCHMSRNVSSEGLSTAYFGASRSMTEIHKNEIQTKIIVIFGVFILIAGLGWIINRFIKTTLLEPMRELKLQTEIVAGFDLRKVITPALERKLTSNDEMGYVTRSFATMIYTLRKTIRRMHDASSEVANASIQISTNMETVAAGAQEQKNQADVVAAAIEKMTKETLANSKNATASAETAQKARLTAEAGGIIVRATEDGMKRIAQATSKSSETAQALEQSSKKIGEIVKLINDIADQTSLLALNAATEAARAGEQGKGFTIVADEVRKLAERTTKATKEIEEMIKRIQRDAGQTVQSMNEGTKEVQHGMKLADEAGQSLQKIVEISQKVTDMISHIASESKQQTNTHAHISKSIEIIDSITQQMVNSTREAAITSEGLHHLTEQLQKMVDEFKLDADDSDSKQTYSANPYGRSSKNL